MFSPLVVPSVIALVFVAMTVGETLSPLRPRVEPWLRHVGRNLVMGGVSFAVMTLIQTPILVPVAEWIATHRFGLLHWANVPRPWSIVLGVLLLDYTLWIWHWANHRVPLLWRFHLPHHVDRDLDASTALRFHFGELALSVPVRAIQIAVIGADPLAVATWQAVLFASILFHHSNLRLPLRVESVLVRVIVTPRMHGIHHSLRREETDSNWSSILTIWDTLHRTFRFYDASDVTIGVPAYRDSRDVTVGKMLALPFRHQRRDWESRESQLS